MHRMQNSNATFTIISGFNYIYFIFNCDNWQLCGSYFYFWELVGCTHYRNPSHDTELRRTQSKRLLHFIVGKDFVNLHARQANVRWESVITLNTTLSCLNLLNQDRFEALISKERELNEAENRVSPAALHWARRDSCLISARRLWLYEGETVVSK